MRRCLENKTAVIVLVLFIILSLVELSTADIGIINGDDAEYAMQLEAFQNHFSFGITEEDVIQAEQDFPEIAQRIDSEFYENKSNHLHEYKGKMYSNHYGSYSALVMPVKVIIQKLGVRAIWAFSITNVILYISALLVIVFFMKGEIWLKNGILLLTAFNPALFYLTWTHSEVYIFSFVTIGLVFFYNKSYELSILFLSIAAMQNLGVIPFAMMVGIDFIYSCIDSYKTENDDFRLDYFIKEYSGVIISRGIFYLPAFIPLILTYLKFGTFSLVADVARESKYLSSKALSYLFDLNLGMLPFEPFIIALFFVAIIIGWIKNRRLTIINAVGIAGMLYIVSNQRQINCGMQYIMRYNVWILPPIIFFALVCLGEKTKKVYIVSVAQAGFMICMIGFLYFGGSYTRTQFAPWTKVILNNIPQIYNPVNGIYYSRVIGQEVYYSNDPIVYYDDEGLARKILLSDTAMELFETDEVAIADENYRIVEKDKLRHVKVQSGAFEYINFGNGAVYARKYNLGVPLLFRASDQNEITLSQYFIAGMSKQEENGSWTDGESVRAFFYIEEGEKLTTEIEVNAAYFQPQAVTIFINGNEVFNEDVNGESVISFDFERPEDGVVEMLIKLPDATQPAQVSDSEDTRDLGIRFVSMVINSK